MTTAQIYLSRDGAEQFLARADDVGFEPDTTTEAAVVNLFPERRYQAILGFGGAFTETSAYNFAQVSPDNQAKILRAYFDKATGLGLNFCRTQIHSSDFSLAEYTYVDDGDASLASFSIEHDRRWLLPFIKAAQALAGDLLLFASPWSPPAWMKDNGKFIEGGKLLPQYADTWARYMAKYLTEYGKEGIDFFGLSVQNEPAAAQTWESCQYSAEEEALFVRDHLKPALVAAGLPEARILIWDHNKERVYDRARDVLAQPGVAECVWGVAFHWYSGDHFAGLAMAHEAFPDKALVFSECSVGSGRREIMTGPHSSWDGLALHTRELIGDFNNYTTAVVDWNLIVDETGGPYHNRDAGCKAPIVVDPTTDTVTLEPLYYAVAHFSRFVARGAVRIGSSTFSDEVPAVGFVNPDSALVAVLLNTAATEQPVNLRLNDTVAAIVLPARTLATVVVPAAPAAA